MIQAADLAVRAPLLALLDSAERAWRVAGLMGELEGLGYVERRLGESLDVYRLSPPGRRTLHH